MKVKKIKLKTKKSFSKRVVVLASGKLKRKQTNRSHLSANKSTKQKRHLRMSMILNKSQMKRAAHLLNI